MSALVKQLVAAEIRAAHPGGDHLDAIAAVVEQRLAIDGDVLNVIDKGGKVRPGVTVSALIGELKSEMPILFRNETKSSSAESKSSESNPYSKATWNMTKQALLERRNPELAARLEKEAQ